MQCIVTPRDRADSVTKRRMRGDIGDPLAIDIDVAPVAQTLDIFRPGEGAAFIGDEIFRAHGNSPSRPRPLRGVSTEPRPLRAAAPARRSAPSIRGCNNQPRRPDPSRPVRQTDQSSPDSVDQARAQYPAGT